MEAQVSGREKQAAALASVGAGVLLTVFKIVVAILSGSLAILAEAAHSALDLVSALTTWWAVRYSGRPADENHHYGHGKAENLSALFETILLIATCLWIIYEGIQRLFVRQAVIDASIWAFLVMFTSIAIDYNRSRMLHRAARKHHSQALEADALNYRADLLSSLVVIIGLGLVWLSAHFTELRFLWHADALAAIAVALLILVISARLGGRAVGALLDVVPAAVDEQAIIRAVETLPGVIECHQVRVRASGPSLFVDVHVIMDENMPLKEVHDLMTRAEEKVRELLPGADVTIHPEPQSEMEDVEGAPKR